MTGEQILRPLDKPYVYTGEGGGEVAYRDLAQCPPRYAEEGALWPSKPKWHWRAIMWAKEKFWTVLRFRDKAAAYQATRTLWRRHPWLRTGKVWWRPYWFAEHVHCVDHYEFIDPTNGLHRWCIDRRDGEAWEFDDGAYWDFVHAARDGLPPPVHATPLERGREGFDVLSLGSWREP